MEKIQNIPIPISDANSDFPPANYQLCKSEGYYAAHEK